LDIQLPMQSVPITTDVEFESRSGRGVQHYVIMFVSDLRHIDNVEIRSDVDRLRTSISKVAGERLMENNPFVVCLFDGV
jgi:hypothetical protein